LRRSYNTLANFDPVLAHFLHDPPPHPNLARDAARFGASNKIPFLLINPSFFELTRARTREAVGMAYPDLLSCFRRGLELEHDPMGDNPDSNSRRKVPALLALVEPKWLDEAFEEFKKGKPEIFFGTGAEIGQAAELPIKNVYFKTTGTTTVVAKAKFTEITTINPVEKRLTSSKTHTTVYKFYYGFCELTWLPRILLSSLRFFTGTPVPNDVPGACIIEEIPVGGGC
jgi:hypothetical protein